MSALERFLKTYKDTGTGSALMGGKMGLAETLGTGARRAKEALGAHPAAAAGLGGLAAGGAIGHEIGEHDEDDEKHHRLMAALGL